MAWSRTWALVIAVALVSSAAVGSAVTGEDAAVAGASALEPSGGLTVIDFEDLADAALVHDQYHGVAFSTTGVDGFPRVVTDGATKGICGINSTFGTIPPHCGDQMTVTFATPASDVAFALLSSAPIGQPVGSVTVTKDVDGTPTTSDPLPIVSSGDGVKTAVDLTDHEKVTAVTITSFLYSAGWLRPLLDDLQFRSCTVNDPDNVPPGADPTKEWWAWGPAFDADGDGLPDAWEEGSVIVDGEELELHQTYGTSSTRKDLFLYLDHEAGEELPPGVDDRVKAAFAASPLDIAVHIIRGTSVPDSVVGNWTGKTSEDYARVQAASGFDASPFAGGCGVPQLAKYFISIEPCSSIIPLEVQSGCGYYDTDGLRPVGPDSETGEIVAQHEAGRAPLKASVGSVAYDPSSLMKFLENGYEWYSGIAEFSQASNLVHELGHSLGLNHHGILSKPSSDTRYRSTMSYAYSAFGLPAAGGTRIIDYSRTTVVNFDWAMGRRHGSLTLVDGQWGERADASAASGATSSASPARGTNTDWSADVPDEWSSTAQIEAADPSSVDAMVEELGIPLDDEAPSASSFEVVAPSGAPTVVPLTGTDPDGNDVTYRIAEFPAHGTLLLGDDGHYRYTSDVGFVGADSITYRAFDGRRASAPATVELTVEGAADRDRSYVAALYEDFLDRAPTAAELDAAATALRSGSLTRRALADRLARSDEWISAIVERMYQDTLGRPGDPSGTAYWIKQLKTGRRSVAAVAAAFYASPEYFTKLGGGTAASWVADLYPKLLGRPADPGGLEYWTKQVARRGRPWVALTFFQSDESCRVRVARLYEDLLHRAPDASGLAFWAGRVRTRGDLALAIELTTSSEYVNRSVVRFPTA